MQGSGRWGGHTSLKALTGVPGPQLRQKLARFLFSREVRHANFHVRSPEFLLLAINSAHTHESYRGEFLTSLLADLNVTEIRGPESLVPTMEFQFGSLFIFSPYNRELH